MNTCLMLWSITMYLIFGLYASILFCRSAQLGREIDEDTDNKNWKDFGKK